jgi:hypothetical protein
VKYEAIFLCSVALLRGHVLQTGLVRARLRDDRDAYDEAQRFVGAVGAKIAQMTAHRALAKRAPKNGRIQWL